MPFYRILLRGENFALNEDGLWKLMGFYTTRYVRALNPQTAERLVIGRMKDEPKFAKPLGYAGGPSATVRVEEIERLKLPPLRRKPGVAWFLMDEE